MAATNGLLSVRSQGFGMIKQNLEKLIRKKLMPPLKQAILDSAEEICFIATEMAPRDTGTLESAIEVKQNKHDYQWRRQAEVWVRPSVYNSKAHTRVGTYADDVEENVTPAGSKKLGPGSVEKNGMIPDYDGVGVGGGYMSRAVKYAEPFIRSRLNKAIQDALLNL